LNDKYQNTSRKRERVLNIPLIVVVLASVCCAAYIIPAYFLTSPWREEFYAYFSFVPVTFLHNYDMLTQLSAVTYSFLHGNLTHLGLNMLWLIVFGAPLANRLGNVFFLIFWVITAYIAALTYCMFNSASDAMLIGASGVISGLMGAAARYNFQTYSGSYVAGALLPIRRALVSRSVLIALGSFILLNALTALDEGNNFAGDNLNIAWQAHLGGLLGGFFIIGYFDKWSQRYR